MTEADYEQALRLIQQVEEDLRKFLIAKNEPALWGAHCSIVEVCKLLKIEPEDDHG
jgi:hypothetical protein